MLDKEIIQGRKDRAAYAALIALRSYEHKRLANYSEHEKNLLSAALDSGLFRCFHGALPSTDDVYKQDRQTLINQLCETFSTSPVLKLWLSATQNKAISDDAQELATKAVDACIQLLRD